MSSFVDDRDRSGRHGEDRPVRCDGLAQPVEVVRPGCEAIQPESHNRAGPVPVVEYATGPAGVVQYLISALTRTS
jgi:hypothetical protein